MPIITVKKLQNHPLRAYTTLKIGGYADEIYIPQSVEAIYEMKDDLNREKITIMGRGSNLLISSKGVREKVVLTSNLKNHRFLDKNTIKVESGLKSNALAKILLEHNLSGLEFLVGIPGSIGGAITMNSSAHGQAIEDVIMSAEVIDLHTNEIHVLDRADLKLGYRNSFVEKNRHFILSAVFRLEEDDYKNIAEKMDFHISYRKRNHPPLTEPNAGSTFRNPGPGIYAGKLLEELGAKQWREGDAAISDKHCNFIINTGNATSLDVSRLMQRMHMLVLEEFGYNLIAEIRFIGERTGEEEEIWSQFTVH